MDAVWLLLLIAAVLLGICIGFGLAITAKPRLPW